MIDLSQRKTLLTLIIQACKDGARLRIACRQIGLTARTVQRWLHPNGKDGDARVSELRAATVPINKLSALEQQAALERNVSMTLHHR